MRYIYSVSHRLLIAVSILALLPSFAVIANSDNKPQASIDENRIPVSCKEPRPAICYLKRQPVCGILKQPDAAGVQSKSYTNDCMACADQRVKGFHYGECH